MSRSLLQRAVLALPILTLACGGGTGDITGTNPTVSVSFAQDSQSTLLGRDMTYLATFTSVGGFSGTVSFTVDSLPAGWTVDFASAIPIVLTSGGSQTRSIGISIATDADAGGHVMVLHAAAGSQEYLKPFKLLVFNEFELQIDLGTVAGPHWGSIANHALNMRVGSRLTFSNADTITHRIHASGSIPGFNHEDDPGMGPGDTFSATFTGAGDDLFYCHDHPDADSVAIHVY